MPHVLKLRVQVNNINITADDAIKLIASCYIAEYAKALRNVKTIRQLIKNNTVMTDSRCFRLLFILLFLYGYSVVVIAIEQIVVNFF